MKENKKVTRKQLVTMSVGVGLLIVLAITATYAFFRFGNNNAFGTSKLTAKTPENGSKVILENINNTLLIDLNQEDMMQTSGNTTYWASPEGKKTSETINQIGKAKAMVEGTYTCNYTMTIEDKATDSIYNAFQGMSTKSNNQIVLTVNEEEYDFNQSDLFPITYRKLESGITLSESKYITSSMYIKNELDIDQTDLNDKDVNLEFKITEFNCKENEELPKITRFAIGDDSDEGILYENNPTVYIEWNNENIAQYCITNTNDSSTCTWTNTTSNNGIEVEYETNLDIGDNLTLYSYIKDNEGFISQVASKEVTMTQNTYPLTITKGPGVTQICTKINGADDYTCETPVGDSITKEVELNSVYSYYGVASGNILDTCYDNNTHKCSGTMDNEEGKTHNIYANMAKYVISISDSTGSNGVITQTHPDSTVQTGTNQATDYRYIGASENVNNYVCFETLTNDETCNKKFRIIGVMPTQTTKTGTYENRIKLISEKNYNYYIGNNTNKWSGSGSKNDITKSSLFNTILNQTFYNSLEEKYQKMIGNSVWYLGSYKVSYAKNMYLYERNENVYSGNPTYVEQKIGLIYPSDFGYATAGGTTILRVDCIGYYGKWANSGATDCKNNDWIYSMSSLSSSGFWTISPTYDSNAGAYYLTPTGNVDTASVTNGFDVYPTFYLTKNIKVVSGNGTTSSPYTISQ